MLLKSVDCGQLQKLHRTWCLLVALCACVLAAGQQKAQADTAVDEVKLRGAIINDPDNFKVNHCFIRGAFVLKAGSTLPVMLLGPLDANELAVGQPVRCMLLKSIVAAEHEMIPEGSIVEGWVCDLQRARRVISAKLSLKHWCNAHALINIHFGKLFLPDGRQFQISAGPAPKATMYGNGESEKLTVSKHGTIEPRYKGRLYDIASNAAGFATIPFGPVGFIADTALSAAAGAIDPAYAFDRPVKDPDAVDRTKGFVLGTIKALPCGFLITDSTNHGGEIMMPAGSELDVRLNSDLVMPLTGELKGIATLD